MKVSNTKCYKIETALRNRTSYVKKVQHKKPTRSAIVNYVAARMRVSNEVVERFANNLSCLKA